jgi:hypothetical protein
MLLPCRIAPSTNAATSEAVQLISWEWMAMLVRSPCH